MIRSLFFTERTYLQWLNDNYWWPVILCVLIIAVAFYFIFFYKPKPKELEVSSETLDTVILLFGGKDNIINISKDGSRFSFELKKIDACNMEGLKKLGATGIFVSGSNVKLIFPFKADKLLDSLK